MPTAFIIGIVVLIIVFLVLYFGFSKSISETAAPEAPEPQEEPPAEEPPKPSETAEEVDPFKSAEPPKS